MCSRAKTLWIRVASYVVFWSDLQWLRTFDQRVTESMEYALCLNTLGSSSDKLWLHVSKPPENVLIKEIFNVHSCSLFQSTYFCTTYVAIAINVEVAVGVQTNFGHVAE